MAVGRRALFAGLSVAAERGQQLAGDISAGIRERREAKLLAEEKLIKEKKVEVEAEQLRILGEDVTLGKKTPQQIGGKLLAMGKIKEAQLFLTETGKQVRFEKKFELDEKKLDLNKKNILSTIKKRSDDTELAFLRLEKSSKGDSGKLVIDYSDRFQKDRRTRTRVAIRNNFTSMKSVLDDIIEENIEITKTGGVLRDFGAVDQVLITLFNKLLDPDSVVRESEYARTGQNLALMNFLLAKLQKIPKGGSLEPAFRQELVDVSDEIFNASEQGYALVVNDYAKNAINAGLSANSIVGNAEELLFKFKDEIALSEERLKTGRESLITGQVPSDIQEEDEDDVFIKQQLGI